MARPYSNDLRERVVAAVASGRPCREVAAVFGVSVASVVKWSQRHRATGTPAARAMGGHRKRVLEPYRAFLRDRLATVPDLTMPALVAELAVLGVVTNPVTVWRLVRSEGMTFKKNAVRHRAGPARNRAAAGPVEDISGSD
jgi:transposase